MDLAINMNIRAIQYLCCFASVAVFVFAFTTTIEEVTE